MMTSQVVFDVQRSLQRFMDLQTDMSSGKRINRPSDDPVGTLRDLDYRTELSKLGQFQDNVTQGQNWLSTYDSILSDVNDLLSDAKDVAIAMSNDTFDETQRLASANEVRAIFDRMIQLSGTQLGGRQMFSGFRTKLEPLRVYGNGVTYLGDSGRIEFEIESQVHQPVNLTGDEVFLKSTSTLGEKADINIGVTDTTLLANLNGGSGVDLVPGTFTITDQNLIGVSATVDLTAAPPATTVDEAITRINDALTAAGMNTNISVSLGDDGNNLMITTSSSGQISTATELSRLNDGQGVDLSRGTIHVTDGAGIDVFVDFSTAVNVGDVITLFNTRMAAEGMAGVVMSVNAAGTGFVIDDASGPPLNLTIENANSDDITAAQLGLTGPVGAQLVGADLNPEESYLIADGAGSTAADLGIADEFTYTSGGSDLDPQLTVDSNLTDLRNGTGFDGDQFVMYQGELTYTVDLSDPALVTVQDLLDEINNSALDVTASINSAGTGIQIENNDEYRSFAIEDVDGDLVAKQMDIYGSSDMMGSLLVLEHALRNNDQNGINRLLANFDDAITVALDVRAGIGTNAMRLESTSSRLLDMELNFTRLLSEVEDADMTELITSLAAQENSYQASLLAAAKIIQPSLLDFLR
jgi:flagellar hook-associated protein 3